MLVLWMISLMLVSALVGLAALASERLAAGWGAPLRWIWLTAFPLALVLHAIPGAVWLSAWNPVAAGGGVGLPDVLAWAGPTRGAAPEAAPGGGLPGAAAIVSDLWMALTALLLLRWCTGGIRARRLLATCARTRLAHGEVLVSRDVGPATIGVLRTHIVVPRWCLAVTDTQRALVVSHEEEHVRARDPLLIALATGLCVLLPWNLAFWAYRARLRAAVEVDCDARVLARYPRARRTYGELLLAVASRCPPFGLAFAVLPSSDSTLRRRIQMIARRMPRISPLRASLLSSAAALLVVSSCLVPGADDPPTGPEAMEAELAEVSGPDRSEAQPRDVRPPPPEASTRDLAEQPVFTPFEVRPEVLNAPEVRAALETEYPASLQEAGIGGVVVLQMFIDESGEVRRVVVHESSGQADLDTAARRVGERMRFSPALNRDEAVPVWIQQSITFQTR